MNASMSTTYDRAADQHEAMPSTAAAGDQAERQLKQTAREERDRDQQPDLGVTEMKVGPNKREGSALSPVGELVDELDDQSDGERQRACIAASATVPAAGEGGYGSTSHAPIVAAASAPRRRPDDLRTRRLVRLQVWILAPSRRRRRPYSSGLRSPPRGTRRTC